MNFAVVAVVVLLLVAIATQGTKRDAFAVEPPAPRSKREELKMREMFKRLRRRPVASK